MTYQYTSRSALRGEKLAVCPYLRRVRAIPLTQAALRIFCIKMAVENGVSSTKNVQHADIPIPAGAVRDLRFIDDTALMLAFVGHDGESQQNLQLRDVSNILVLDVPRLVRIHYRSQDQSGKFLIYRKTSLSPRPKETEVHCESTDDYCGIDLTSSDDVALHAVHRFPTNKGWMPQRLEINGRQNRRMICVLAEDGLHFRQYGLDDPEGKRGKQTLAAPSEEPDVAMSTS